MEQLTLTQPDDWHVHLRDGAVLSATVLDTARGFARAVVMPNLTPPVTTTDAALAYRSRILEAAKGSTFEPLMTLYLTDQTTPAMIKAAKKSAAVVACKLYPAGATTNAAAGVTRMDKMGPVFDEMAAQNLPLLIHGEVVDEDVDIFDRERYFIDQRLVPLTKQFPALRIVLEHITTEDAVQFIEASSSAIAATITPHHLLLNRNAMLTSGIHPHYYCLPILKRRKHQEALIKAATSGNPKFFLGTDSAPHSKTDKESACGCAGIYSAPIAIALYAEIFENANSLEKLEGFASFYGADFYGLARNKITITLIKKDQTVPNTLPFGDEQLIPFKAGETLRWSLK